MQCDSLRKLTIITSLSPPLPLSAAKCWLSFLKQVLATLCIYNMCVNVSRAPNNQPFTSKEMQRYLFVLKNLEHYIIAWVLQYLAWLRQVFFFVSPIFETMYLVWKFSFCWGKVNALIVGLFTWWLYSNSYWQPVSLQCDGCFYITDQIMLLNLFLRFLRFETFEELRICSASDSVSV